MKLTPQNKLILLVACLAAGAWIAFELWSFSEPGARLTASGKQPNLELCKLAQEQVDTVLAKPDPTRAELQSLITASADHCIMHEHGFVVGPICTAHPDACVGQLEEDLR